MSVNLILMMMTMKKFFQKNRKFKKNKKLKGQLIKIIKIINNS